MPADLNPHLIPLITTLVGIDSVNPALDPDHPGEAELARYVAGWSEQWGLEVTWLEEYAPGRPSVVVTAPGSGGGRNVLLYAHLDTVGVKGMARPFEARLEGERMYGRGTLDMKSSLAMCMLLVEQASRQAFSGDVTLLCVADEEHDSIGTREAVAHVTEAARYDAAFVTELTHLELHIAHRGFTLFEIDLQGKRSHTSQPEQGVNALTHLGRLLAAVERRNDELRSHSAHPLVGHGSIQAVLAAGGEELFTTPAKASVTVERRTVPGESAEWSLAEMQALLQELTAADPTFRPTLRQVLARSPFEVSPSSELVRLLSAAVQADTGQAPVLNGAPYWTDAALIADAGIPTILFGPTGGAIHQPGEWVDVGSVRTAMRVLERVVGQIAT